MIDYTGIAHHLMRMAVRTNDPCTRREIVKLMEVVNDASEGTKMLLMKYARLQKALKRLTGDEEIAPRN